MKVSGSAAKLALALTFLLGAPALLSQRAVRADEQKKEMKFEIYQDAGKQYRWRLKSVNGKIMATGGQGYAKHATAQDAVENVKSGVGNEKLKFETYEDAAKEFRWRLKASNGQTVASSSESYKAKADCDAAIESIKSAVKDAKVEDISK